MASGSVDGDSVTISTLTEAGGDILATREFLTSEIVENANYVSATVTTDKDITFGIVDSTNSVVETQLVQANNATSVSFNIGYSIAGFKLAVLNNFIQSGTSVEPPVTVSVSNVVEQYIEPVVPTLFWTMNSDNVSASSETTYGDNDAGLEISTLTSAGAQTGAILATHTVTVTPGSETLQLAYFNVGTAVNNAVSFQFYDPDAAVQNYGTFTPSSEDSSSIYTITWSDYVETLPSTFEIRCAANPLTTANLPVGFRLQVGQQ